MPTYDVKESVSMMVDRIVADDTDPAPCARVLIVEDDALVALGVRSILEDGGHPVCGVAACEAEAVKRRGAA